MASPFERAFNPAFQQASAAAMKSLDDERQDKKLQERMLEQRQYDASLLEGSKAYAANLLKDSNKIVQDRIDAANTLAAQRTEQANYPIYYRLAIEAGVPASALEGMTWENNAAILAMTGRETQGREKGKQQALTGTFAPFNYGTLETPEARGYRKQADATIAGWNTDDAATETAAKLRSTVSGEQAARTLAEKRAEYRAETGMVADHEDNVASLTKKIEDYKENRVEGKDYKKTLDEYETETGLSGSGMPLGELSFLLERAKYDKTYKRHIGQTDAISQINMRADSNTYLGRWLHLLNAEERKLVLSSSDDPNKQAAFLRTRLDRVVTNTGKTIDNPSGVGVVTYRLILPPAPAAEAKAGAGAGAGASPTVNSTRPTSGEARQDGNGNVDTENNVDSENLGGTPTPAAKKAVVPPTDNVMLKMEEQSVSKADAAVIHEILGSDIGNVRGNFREAAVKKGSGTLATLNKSIKVDKLGLESLQSRTEVRTLPDGRPYTANKIGFWGRYGDDSEAARKNLSANDFTKYEAETREIAVAANVIQSRIDAGSVKISKLADQLESLRPRLMMGDLRQSDQYRSLVPLPLVPLPKLRVDRNAPNKPPSLGVDRFMPSLQTVPPPPRLEVPPVMAPLPAIPDPSAPRTEANFERMLRENPSQFGGELRGLFDSIMRNRKSNTIKKNLSPQFPPPIPDPRLNLPKR